MGQGAQMSVTNNRKDAVTVFVSSLNCMYDNGQQNSNLQVFNNAVIAGGASVPASGTQYIEDDDDVTSGCGWETATFTLTIIDNTNKTTIGTVSFSESGSAYSGTSSNASLIQVYTSNNSGSESVISVTVI